MLGEDIGWFGGVFCIIDGFFDEFGVVCVIDILFVEFGIVGMVVGLVFCGYWLVVEI